MASLCSVRILFFMESAGIAKKPAERQRNEKCRFDAKIWRAGEDIRTETISEQRRYQSEDDIGQEKYIRSVKIWIREQ